jgi:hypothetical protein
MRVDWLRHAIAPLFVDPVEPVSTNADRARPQLALLAIV